MRTDKQTKASRTNGAKSQGPKTPEGKAKSSQNSNRYNLAGGHIVLLSNESSDQFKASSFGYLDAFAPANFAERDLVFELSPHPGAWLASAPWNPPSSNAETFDYLDSHTRHALTFLNMNNKEDGMRKLHRYQTATRLATRDPIATPRPTATRLQPSRDCKGAPPPLTICA